MSIPITRRTIRRLDDLIPVLQQLRDSHGNLPIAADDDRLDSLAYPLKVSLLEMDEVYPMPADGFDVSGDQFAVIIDTRQDRPGE